MRVLFTFTKMINGEVNNQSFAYDGEDEQACYDAMLEDRGFMIEGGWFCQGQKIPQGNRKTLFGPWESFTELFTKEEIERGQWLGDEPMSVHEKQCGNLYRWLEDNDEGEWGFHIDDWLWSLALDIDYPCEGYDEELFKSQQKVQLERAKKILEG